MHKGRLCALAALLPLCLPAAPATAVSAPPAVLSASAPAPPASSGGSAASTISTISAAEAEQAPQRLLRCGFYDETSFLQSVDGVEPYEAQGSLRAGVVPHHLLAGRMTAGFFARAAEEEYDSIVLVGPGHYPTRDRMITARAGWQTPFGTLENDAEFTARLTGDGRIAAMADEDAMERDHAVAGLIPYVKYYLPEARAAAVLIQNTAEDARVRALTEAIAAYAGQRKVLLVCSIDFSHYLMPGEAAAHDAQTRRALESYDYTAISRFTDSNVDSPHALGIFLRLAEPLGPVSILDHSASERILRLPLSDPIYRDGTTTYFILGALEQEAAADA